MAASKADIKKWFEEGILDPSNTHMIVVCDTFDHEDYPVYVTEDKSARVVASEYDNGSMQTVMEVYNLKRDMEEQLSERRCFNY